LDFKIRYPVNVIYLLNILEEDGHEAYLVGGCVRDSFLGKTPNDWDICTNAAPEDVCALLECYDDIEVFLTGMKHGTITAHIDGENYEITTYRVDGDYTDNRRPDNVTFVSDVTKDLARRDFTINAMAYRRVDDFVDPWGGYEDLRNGVIRCVRNPDDRFQEDALRILRALRFASTYGFKIEEETAAAIHRNKDLLKNVSAERIRTELCKMLCGEGVLDILLEYKDIMAVIIPELEPCIGFQQNNPYHKYDVYDHMVHAVDAYKGTDVSIKMTLLLHDIYKPKCYTEDERGGHFYCHGVFGSHDAEKIMTRLKFDNKTRDEVVALVRHHDTDIHPGYRTVKRWLNKLGEDLLYKLIFVKLADIEAHSEKGQAKCRDAVLGVLLIAKDILAQQQCFSLKDLAIGGKDIIALGVEPGPIVGETLKHLLDLVLDDIIENDHDLLVDKAKHYLEKGEVNGN
jgi:tRNA nucleotidyltransferase (CCA-adding enzyme)